MTLYEILDVVGDNLNRLYVNNSERNISFFTAQVTQPLEKLELEEVQSLVRAILREITFRVQNFNHHGIQSYQIGLFCKAICTKACDYKNLSESE